MVNFVLAAAVLGLGSTAYAQSLASTCPETNLCYALNIPESTASSGNGDIYFQIRAPTSYEWVALGQGSGMAGANIFVVYTSADGQNVTVSPRLGTGHVEPEHNSAAQIEILGGSGVSNGVMTANVRCSSCNTWSGGSMDFTSSSASWIHAYKSGDAMNTDDVSASLSMHDDALPFDWNMANAKGGASVNPFASSSSGSGSSSSTPSSCTPAASVTQTLAQPSGSGCPTAWPTEYSSAWPTARPTWASSCFASGHGSWPTNAPWANDDNNNNKRQQGACDSGTTSSSGNSSTDTSSGDASFSNANANAPYGGNIALGYRVQLVHGVLASLAFVAFFPIGGIIIRIAKFTGLVWIHAALQAVGYAIYIAAFGLGLYLATEEGYMSNHHAIIGIVLFVVLFFQPLSGFLHHRLFKKYSGRTAWSYEHIGIGRIAIILGMVNGGLGLQLAGVSTGYTIAYGVCAGVMGLLYIASIVYGEMKRRRNVSPAYEDSQRMQSRELASHDGSPSGPEYYGKENVERNGR